MFYNHSLAFVSGKYVHLCGENFKLNNIGKK